MLTVPTNIKKIPQNYIFLGKFCKILQIFFKSFDHYFCVNIQVEKTPPYIPLPPPSENQYLHYLLLTVSIFALLLRKACAFTP